MADSALPHQFSGAIANPSIIPSDRSRRKHAKFGLRQSFSAALAGITYTIRTQRNMKIHMLAALCVTLVSLFLGLNLTARAAILFSIALVFFAEIINTAMEAIVDLYVEKFHQFAMVAKDAAAGGVLMLAIIASLLFSNILWVHGDRLVFAAKDPLRLAVASTIASFACTMLFFKIPRIFAICFWMLCLGGAAYLGASQQEPFFAAFAAILVTLIFLSISKTPKRWLSRI